MDLNPLHITGAVSPDMPLFIIKDLALRLGKKSLQLGGLDDVRITASLGKEINSECSSHQLMSDGHANWGEIARLVNPEVEWTKSELLAQFKRLLPLLSLRGWNTPDLETKQQIIEIFGSKPSIRNPTGPKTSDVPPYLAYGFARRCGYSPTMTDGPDRLLNVILHLVHGTTPDLDGVPGEAIDACLYRLPISYNCWYHPSPWVIDSALSHTWTVSKTKAVTALREAASEFGLNLFYCMDPARELETFRLSEARTSGGGKRTKPNFLARPEISSTDTWFDTWYRRNPDYFSLARRYDPNVPAEFYDRKAITERYQVDTLSHVNSLSCRLERGPVPGGGPSDDTDMAVIKDRSAVNIKSSDLIESLSMDDPSYLEYPILAIIAFSREYIGFFDEAITKRIHLLFDREERLRGARHAYLTFRKDVARQGSIRRALYDSSSLSRDELVQELCLVGDYILNGPKDDTELTEEEQVMISILINSL